MFGGKVHTITFCSQGRRIQPNTMMRLTPGTRHRSVAAFVVDAAGKVTLTNAAYDDLFNHHGPLVAL
jgi:hypothetical protein